MTDSEREELKAKCAAIRERLQAAKPTRLKHGWIRMPWLRVENGVVIVLPGELIRFGDPEPPKNGNVSVLPRRPVRSGDVALEGSP